MPPSFPFTRFLIYQSDARSVQRFIIFMRVGSSDCWLLSSIEGLVPGKNRIAGNHCCTMTQHSWIVKTSNDFHHDTLVLGAIDWDLEKVADEAAEREYKRQQAEQQQQQQASSNKGDVHVCGQSLQVIAILFAAFGGVPGCLCSLYRSQVHSVQVSPM